jgi:hypothetical protein
MPVTPAAQFASEWIVRVQGKKQVWCNHHGGHCEDKEGCSFFIFQNPPEKSRTCAETHFFQFWAEKDSNTNALAEW